MDAVRAYFNVHKSLPVSTFVDENGVKIGSWIADMRRGANKKERGILEKEFNIKI